MNRNRKMSLTSVHVADFAAYFAAYADPAKYASASDKG